MFLSYSGMFGLFFQIELGEMAFAVFYFLLPLTFPLNAWTWTYWAFKHIHIHTHTFISNNI